MREAARRDVTVVRPYGDAVRVRVFALLERAGLRIRDENVIPPRTSDEEVIERLRGRRPEVMLIPFHAHRDADGAVVNGIDLVDKLMRELPELVGTPVLMPVSLVGLAGARLRLSATATTPLPEEVRASVLLLDESRLGEEGLAEVVTEHVENVGRRRAAGARG